MSTTTTANTTIGPMETRILREGYGEGAWHGPDLKAALADVTSHAAFWRPAPGRHNIAEIALHHAYCARGVRAKLSGVDAEPFILEGDDWFALSDESSLPWSKILTVVETEQQRLAAMVADIARESPMADAERFDLVLGITCHAVYHAGQVQLIKRLHGQ
jgi:DinB superfamily